MQVFSLNLATFLRAIFFHRTPSVAASIESDYLGIKWNSKSEFRLGPWKLQNR